MVARCHLSGFWDHSWDPVSGPLESMPETIILILIRPWFTKDPHLAKRPLFAISVHGREGFSGIRYRSSSEVKTAVMAKLSKKWSHPTPALPIGLFSSETGIIRSLDFELISTGLAMKPTRETRKTENPGFGLFRLFAVSHPSTYKPLYDSFDFSGQLIEP